MKKNEKVLIVKIICLKFLRCSKKTGKDPVSSVLQNKKPPHGA